MKILIVEDEQRMVELLRKGLQEEGFTVVAAFDPTDSIGLASTCEFDVILLDVMMPQMNGFEVTQTLRRLGVTSPIVMLTARDAVSDIVRGLDAGADDYLTKPFSFEELLARLRAVRRRAEVAGNCLLAVGDLVLDPRSRDVRRAGERISLTRKEYNLLEHLLLHPGEVVSRQSLIEAVWGSGETIEDNTLEAYVHLLRGKVEREGQPRLIHTVRGVGYTVRPEVAS
jgi:two-component system response regulator MprA